VEGQKIAKRRGNNITAGAFAAAIDPDYLRYYLGVCPESRADPFARA
jgi:methionyl-tRNA synthetase